ncbi:hypothetical protein COTS27_00056 [Spirochaetota bacterium]|nr:hypothetical protein COTS27_00056 [Spirochaetota bacterium]
MNIIYLFIEKLGIVGAILKSKLAKFSLFNEQRKDAKAILRVIVITLIITAVAQINGYSAEVTANESDNPINETGTQSSQSPPITDKVTLKPLAADIAVPDGKIKFRRSFEAGERLQFKIRFLGLSGGTAVMSALPSKDNKLITFKIEAYTAPWVEKVYKLRLSLISKSLLANYQTLRYTEDKRENKRVYYNVQDFDLKRNHYTFGHLQDGLFKITNVDYNQIPEGGVSVAAAFYFSRTIDLNIGTTIYRNCFFRERYFQIGIEPIEIKTIRTSFGRKEVIVIRPLLNKTEVIDGQEDLLIYLSNDVTRIPLRADFITKYGIIKAILTDYSSNPNS